MTAKFQCHECKKTFEQPLEQEGREFEDDWGLYVHQCFYCASVYMDCLNLEECLEYLKNVGDRN